MAALADRSHRPESCAHQIAPEIEAKICELRRKHPHWGPRRIEHQLRRDGVTPMPSESSVYRCLKRHNLIELRRRKKRRDEFRRWERERPMQLWQMDVMSGVLLDDGTDLKLVTGVDDHSRFCVAAGLVMRATAKAVLYRRYVSTSLWPFAPREAAAPATKSPSRRRLAWPDPVTPLGVKPLRPPVPDARGSSPTT